MILQLQDSAEIRFQPLRFLQHWGEYPDPKNYNVVYSDSIPQDFFPFTDIDNILWGSDWDFNEDDVIPKDFYGNKFSSKDNERRRTMVENNNCVPDQVGICEIKDRRVVNLEKLCMCKKSFSGAGRHSTIKSIQTGRATSKIRGDDIDDRDEAFAEEIFRNLK